MAKKKSKAKHDRYYVVKHGHVPGIYKNIHDARKQVIGYSGSMMKRFNSHKKAVAFFESKDYDQPEKKQRYYAVAIGHKPGIYDTPEEANKQIKGFSNSKMKMFKNEKDAYHFINEHANEVNMSKINTTSEKDIVIQDTTVKSVMANHAFVDGSFNEKTQTYGYGGVLFCNKGVFTFKGCGEDKRFANLGSLSGELLAATEAIKLAVDLELEEITILYDCEAIELYSQRKPKGNTVQKQYKRFFDNSKNALKIYFKKVRAHSGIDGNEMADILAKSASGAKLKRGEKEYLRIIENMSNAIA